ncbi:MAG: DEAD/DEAH box helicase family protein [Methanosarcinales archaeon]|nr:DEAD/DEAH box helicase family protein [Methanosarcinales archaeon]
MYKLRAIMTFKKLDLKHSYNSEKDNILKDFYVPSLKNAVTYKRIAGYFSSSSFGVASEGLSHFIKNSGRMQFISNVKLFPQDYEQIEKGLTDPEEIIQSKFLKDLSNIQDECIKNHVKVLGWLIANNYLEIKIGYIWDKSIGNEILHQKVGILYDSENNIISFSGSNNESAHGWYYNSEKFKVFFSWELNNNDFIAQDIEDFEELWNNKALKTKVISFPEAVKKHLIEISPKEYIDVEKLLEKINDIQNEKCKSEQTTSETEQIKLREYQLEALKAFFENDCQGIFEMATGTGKTFTALGVLVELLKKENKLITIISCPFLHLTNQWEKSIEKMGLTIPILYASSANVKWKDELIEKILDSRLGKIKQFIVITTHDTVSSKKFITIINETKSPLFFIGDEVHGMGSVNRIEGLLPIYKFRLGLSATPNRYFDELGTNELLEYFNKTVYVFDLARAINEINPETNESYLVPYKYHPLFVELTLDEMNEYSEITATIAILFSKKKRSKNEQLILEQKLRDRQNIIKNAENKFPLFSGLILKLNKEDKLHHTLVYSSPQQILQIQQIIRSCDTIIQHKFTSGEDAIRKQMKYNGLTEREYILTNFDKANYHILVAIKCLDEGVDVPSTKNAILMCSSGNPKEYVQRRGRVLRRYPGKKYANIYDITALPNYGQHRSSHEIEDKMINSQLKRIEEFSKDSMNESDILREVYLIKKKYGI